MAAFDGGSIASDTGLLLRRLDQRLSLFDLAWATDPLGQVTRPVVHQDTPAFEQVRAGIGRLHPVADHVRQGRLDHFPGMIRRPQETVNIFILLPLYILKSHMIPPEITLYRRGFGIRFQPSTDWCRAQCLVIVCKSPVESCLSREGILFQHGLHHRAPHAKALPHFGLAMPPSVSKN